MVGLLLERSKASAAMGHCERGLTMSSNMDNEKNNPPDTEACEETVASQEEIYLETTEEELRADLTCEVAAAEKANNASRKAKSLDG
jgi:hypothetical protein